jgi:hypothetical protein
MATTMSVGSLLSYQNSAIRFYHGILPVITRKQPMKDKQTGRYVKEERKGKQGKEKNEREGKKNNNRLGQKRHQETGELFLF